MSESKEALVANLGPVLGLCPFECPDVALVSALARTEAFAVLDLGHDVPSARAALLAIGRLVGSRFGARIPEHFDADGLDLPRHPEDPPAGLARAGRATLSCRPRGPD